MADLRRLSPEERAEVLAHLQESAAARVELGATPEAAWADAVRAFGRVRRAGTDRGTWIAFAIACVPSVIVEVGTQPNGTNTVRFATGPVADLAFWSAVALAFYRGWRGGRRPLPAALVASVASYFLLATFDGRMGRGFPVEMMMLTIKEWTPLLILVTVSKIMPVLLAWYLGRALWTGHRRLRG